MCLRVVSLVAPAGQGLRDAVTYWKRGGSVLRGFSDVCAVCSCVCKVLQSSGCKTHNEMG